MGILRLGALPADSASSERELRFGPMENLSTRDKMIVLTLEGISDSGPADFNAFEVCDTLGIKHPMVNYHFGNRDGMIAEATWWLYQRWITNVTSAILNAPADPRKRITAFVNESVEGARKLGGAYLLLHYPLSSKNSQNILQDKHHDDMERKMEYVLALLAICVKDVREGTVSDLNFDEHTLPRTQVLRDAPAAMAATHIAWMVHGLAAWSSGNHLATNRLSIRTVTKDISVELSIRSYVTAILRVAAGE